MDQVKTFLYKDLNEITGCECCKIKKSTHLLFIHPTDKGGGCCGVFHICETCITPDFNFGEGQDYMIIKKYV